jgi:tetratricopeptide (TPR) repeat protein
MRRAAVICACLLTGCAGGDDTLPLTRAGFPATVTLTNIPFNSQQGFGCGPAVMASALAGAGIAIKPEALTGRFYGETGDPRDNLMDTARHYGRLAAPVHGLDALEAELAAGHPVLIVENLGVARKPLWNCAIAVGYRDSGARLVINENDQQSKAISRNLLDRLWSETDSWGLVVLRPGEIPASASEFDMVAAAGGLLQSGHYREAVTVYDSILGKWPTNTDARMGLGTCLYLLGDVRGAADSYRTAAAEAADPRPALAALDHILAELDRRQPDEEIATLPPPKARDISAPSRRIRK